MQGNIKIFNIHEIEILEPSERENKGKNGNSSISSKLFKYINLYFQEDNQTLSRYFYIRKNKINCLQQRKILKTEKNCTPFIGKHKKKALSHNELWGAEYSEKHLQIVEQNQETLNCKEQTDGYQRGGEWWDGLSR